MNKNIRELAMEAGFAHMGFSHENNILAQELVIDKFARLLLLECLMIAELNGEMNTGYQIKHHFGI